MTVSPTYLHNISLSLRSYEDPRTRNWLFISSPIPTATLCLLYIVGANFIGPKIMQNKKPFDLKRLLVAYNLFQVLFSAWLFYEFSASGWLTGEYSFKCQPINYSTNPHTMRMVNTVWWFYFSKFTELSETIFFIMRKKFSQVNALHLYHHSIMPLSGWLSVKYYPSGHGTFPGLINTFVHIIMYSYYLLSAFGPEVQKYLWWKKYITTLQIVQFVVIMMHALQVVLLDCNFPKIFVWYMTILALSFYVLFKNFYNKTYTEKKLKK